MTNIERKRILGSTEALLGFSEESLKKSRLLDTVVGRLREKGSQVIVLYSGRYDVVPGRIHDFAIAPNGSSLSSGKKFEEFVSELTPEKDLGFVRERFSEKRDSSFLVYRESQEGAKMSVILEFFSSKDAMYRAIEEV